MKRSEMVEIMMGVIYRNCGKRITDEEVIEQILEAQEEAGMLPPFNGWTFHTDGDHACPDKVIYHTWEEEESVTTEGRD